MEIIGIFAKAVFISGVVGHKALLDWDHSGHGELTAGWVWPLDSYTWPSGIFLWMLSTMNEEQLTAFQNKTSIT